MVLKVVRRRGRNIALYINLLLYLTVFIHFIFALCDKLPMFGDQL